MAKYKINLPVTAVLYADCLSSRSYFSSFRSLMDVLKEDERIENVLLVLTNPADCCDLPEIQNWIDENKATIRFLETVRLVGEAGQFLSTFHNEGLSKDELKDSVAPVFGEYFLFLSLDTIIINRDRNHDWLGELLFSVTANPDVGLCELKPFTPCWGYEPGRETRCERAGCLMANWRKLSEHLASDDAGETASVEEFVHRLTGRDDVEAASSMDGRTGHIRLGKVQSEPIQCQESIIEKLEKLQIPREQFGTIEFVDNKDIWQVQTEPANDRLVYSEEDLSSLLEVWESVGGLLVLRHAHKITDPDVPDRMRNLTKGGIEKTRKLSSSIQVPLDGIWTSGLLRCRTTAEILSKDGCPIVTHAVLEGPEIRDKEQWNFEKKKFGWSALFYNWISKKFSSDIIQPFDVWSDSSEFKEFLKELSGVKRGIVIGQGIVTQSLGIIFHNRVEFSGAGLCGYLVPVENINKLVNAG